MKNKLTYTLGLSLLLLPIVFGDEANDSNKHPNDPCPQGLKEVIVEDNSNTFSGEIKGSAKGNIGILKGEASSEVEVKSGSTKTTTKVCRDSKGKSFKHPKDPCPSGKQETHKVVTSPTMSGGAGVKGGKNIGIAKVSIEGKAKVRSGVQKESSKTCEKTAIKPFVKNKSTTPNQSRVKKSSTLNSKPALKSRRSDSLDMRCTEPRCEPGDDKCNDKDSDR